jgi:translation elongation factor EF-1alpha
MSALFCARATTILGKTKKKNKTNQIKSKQNKQNKTKQLLSNELTGTPVEFLTQSTEVAGKIVTLVGLVDKATGEQIKACPRFLTEGQAALVDITLASSVCIEKYKDFRSLARFMLRDHGKTIAAGVVMELL